MQKVDDCCKKGDDDVEINLAKCLSKSIITCSLDGVRSVVLAEQQEQFAFLQLLREFNNSKGKLFDPAVLESLEDEVRIGNHVLSEREFESLKKSREKGVEEYWADIPCRNGAKRKTKQAGS